MNMDMNIGIDSFDSSSLFYKDKIKSYSLDYISYNHMFLLKLYYEEIYYV
mgnify:CR=1 FL=1